MTHNRQTDFSNKGAVLKLITKILALSSTQTCFPNKDLMRWWWWW